MFQKERDHVKELYAMVLKSHEMKKPCFSFAKFKQSDKDISFYTGFPNYRTLHQALVFLDVGDNGENLIPNNNKEKSDSTTKPKKLCVEDFFFSVGSSKALIV